MSDNLKDDNEVEDDDAKWGQKFRISVDAGGSPQSKWAKQRGNKTSLKATLHQQVLNFLVDKCLPFTTLSHLDCFTHYENKSTGDRYHSHPMFMGDTWYDFAMVRWQSRTHPKLPARICTFVDLTNLVPGRNVCTYDNAQPALGAGFYTVIELFEPVPQQYGYCNGNPNDNDEAYANDLIGRFLRTETIINGQSQPCLYLVHVDSILSPLVGIMDVARSSMTPNNPSNPHRHHRGIQVVRSEQEHYLFLLHHRSTWAACWNGVIRNLHGPGDHNGEETTEPEDTWSINN